MNKTFAILTAVTLALASASAFADDKTPSDFTPAEQAKLKQQADANKAATAKMTPEEQAAAKEAKDTEALKEEATIERITQNPGDARNMAINKSAAASKAGPPPRHVDLNSPVAEKFLSEQKGQ